MFQIKRYGWKPDHPDHRDFKYAAPAHVLKATPPSVDLRPGCPHVFDQLSLGSCTANAIAGNCMYVEKKLHPNNVIMPSRMFIYFNERRIEGTMWTDSGAYLRDGMKAINQWGYPDEPLWPYDLSNAFRRPLKSVYVAARKELIKSYSRLDQVANQLKGCLADGFPLVFGFTVYESFESDQVAKTGIMTMPLRSESVIGGHAVCMVGYDDDKQWWIVRNSWGPNWGDHGYFFMPYNYALDSDLSADFWTVRAA